MKTSWKLWPAALAVIGVSGYAVAILSGRWMFLEDQWREMWVAWWRWAAVSAPALDHPGRLNLPHAWQLAMRPFFALGIRPGIDAVATLLVPLLALLGWAAAQGQRPLLAATGAALGITSFFYLENAVAASWMVIASIAAWIACQLGHTRTALWVAGAAAAMYFQGWAVLAVVAIDNVAGLWRNRYGQKLKHWLLRLVEILLVAGLAALSYRDIPSSHGTPGAVGHLAKAIAYVAGGGPGVLALTALAIWIYLLDSRSAARLVIFWLVVAGGIWLKSDYWAIHYATYLWTMAAATAILSLQRIPAVVLSTCLVAASLVIQFARPDITVRPAFAKTLSRTDVANQALAIRTSWSTAESYFAVHQTSRVEGEVFAPLRWASEYASATVDLRDEIRVYSRNALLPAEPSSYRVERTDPVHVFGSSPGAVSTPGRVLIQISGTQSMGRTPRLSCQLEDNGEFVYPLAVSTYNLIVSIGSLEINQACTGLRVLPPTELAAVAMGSWIVFGHCDDKQRQICHEQGHWRTPHQPFFW